MVIWAALLTGFILGAVALFLLLNWPDESEWRRSGAGWKRKRHGRWELTNDELLTLR